MRLFIIASFYSSKAMNILTIRVLERAAEFNPVFGLKGQLLDQIRRTAGRN